MKNPVIITLVALAIALLTLSDDDAASAQVVSLCIGNGQVNGRIVTGTPFGDFIDCSVSSGDLVIFWLGGNDWLVGGRGADFIDGGPGDDILIGRDSKDFIRGGPGKDFLAGGRGDDLLRGEDGADQLFGGDDNDLLFGGAGDDIMFGGANLDLCDGQEGSGDLASTSCEMPANVP